MCHGISLKAFVLEINLCTLGCVFVLLSRVSIALRGINNNFITILQSLDIESLPRVDQGERNETVL